MPTLSLRPVGRSFMLEGLRDSPLNSQAILDALTERYGLAVAAMSGGELERSDQIDALILDKKAAPLESMRAGIEDSVHRQGWCSTLWTIQMIDRTPIDVLHYHRQGASEEESAQSFSEPS